MSDLNRIFPKARVTVGNVRAENQKLYLTVADAAEMLGKRQNTIINWCKSGELFAIPAPFGTKISWHIPIASVIAKQESLQDRQQNRINQKIPKRLQSHRDLITTYDRFCEQGLISGRPYSPATRKTNKYYLTYFLNKYEYATFRNLRAELLEIPVEMFAKRHKIWEIIWNFTKWLAVEEYGEQETAEKIRKLRPKRHLPAKRHSLREDELDAMENACKNSYEKAIVILLSHTGVRSSEFCSWTMKDINLEYREIKFIGKGGVDRWVGLTNKAFETLVQYLIDYPPTNDSESIFKGKHGKPLTRYGLYSRVSAIGDRIGVEAHPHCMRRSFVTVNVAKGRSLVHLQLLCGHSDIQTTRSYCRTSQEEAVNMVKDWD